VFQPLGRPTRARSKHQTIDEYLPMLNVGSIFRKPITHGATLGETASSAYENDTAASVIASRLDGVANLVERYCAADMAV
jgi:hypothetical protein